jgi:chromosome segregation protein
MEKFQAECLKVDPEMNDVERKISAERRDLKEYEEKLKKIESSRPESREKGEKLRREREMLVLEKNRLEKEAGGMDVRVEILEERKKETGAKAEYGTLFSFAKNFYDEAKRALKEGVSVAAAEKILKEAVLSFEKIFSAGSENLEKEIKEAKEKKEKLKEKIKEFDEKLKAVGREEMEVGKGLENFTEDFRKAFTLVEERRKKIGELEAALGKLSLEKERWGMKIADLKEAVRQAGRNWEEFYAKRGGEKISEENLPEIERRIFRLRGELASIGDVDESLKKEAEETEERHNFLEKQLADLETAGKDLKEAIIELSEKIHIEFNSAMTEINREFEKFFGLMFKGGKAKMKLAKPKKKTEDAAGGGEEGNLEGAPNVIETEEEETEAGIDLDLSLPKKKITGLDVLSGGERSLVSIAALFALISVSPPPFLVLDEVDAPLDERNALKFAEMVKDFSKKAQFVVVTHNRATMEMADALYGVTLGEDGASKVVSLKMTD